MNDIEGHTIFEMTVDLEKEEVVEPPAPTSGWADLAPELRNALIAKCIGAELLGQFYLFINGLSFSPLAHGRNDRDKAEALAEFARGKGWKEFKKTHGFPDHLRSTVEARLVEWPLRYSDTPGGGWEVVKALRDRGCDIEVASTGDGWMITVDDGNPHHGKIIEHAHTMQEAACLAALRLYRPNTDSTTVG